MKNQDILKYLLDKKLIDPRIYEELKKQVQQTGVPVEQAIFEKNVLSEEKVTKAKGEMLNIPYVDLSGKIISNDVLTVIPKKVAENYRIVAFEKAGSALKVAMVDPRNFKAIEAVEFLAQESHQEVKYYIISPNGFRNVFKQYEILSEEAEEALAGVSEINLQPEHQLELSDNLEEIVKSAPVSKMVLVIMRHAIDGRASDIHIEPQIRESRVRYRIDGILRTTLVLPKYIHSAIISRIKVLANLKLDETRKPQDGRIRLTLGGKNIDFRVSTLPLFEGEKVVMRVLDTSVGALTLKDLGFNDIQINIIEQSIKRPHGLVLVTGPTGSGKTTTLYSVLTILNKDGINIITLEDPIEYYINGVNQSQINPEVGYSFAAGLRSILRQDPNVIMVGEIRDEETAELAIHAGLTGHLVLSTLHTNDSIGAIPRLIDMGAKPFLLASTINVVIAQRLARKICQKCREKAKVPDKIVNELRKDIEKIPAIYLQGMDKTLTFYTGKGCTFCGNLGHQGRIAIGEAINITDDIKELISKGYHQSEFDVELKKQDFITLRQDALVKAAKGLISLEEVFRVTQL